MRIRLLILLIVAAITNGYGQTAQDYAIQLSATTQVSPAQIRLQWRKISYGTPIYSVFKKAKTATSWGAAIATITTGDTTYTDNSVIVDSVYEYSVRTGGTGLATSSTGYILAGIKAPAIHNRGALILLVDSTFTDSCATELAQLATDINADGWQVIRHDVSRTAKDTAIKALIKADHSSIPNVNAVLLVGHVAVPYSGDLNPDAHPDHLGAWPSDVYYGCLTTTWTDVSVNDVVSSNTANHNIPGDGKWDQSTVPEKPQLQVSRIDFNNMPAFSSSEIQMMRRYLAKSHTYKLDQLPMRKRALVNDNFGAFSGEAFAANAWRNFAPMVSRDSIFNLPFINALADSSFQWAYGCGGGTYTSAGGIGNTSNFAAAGATHAIFTMMFGSYFGDWNYQNSFLRAPLCADTPALTSCWAGRPNWFVHHMALGEHIGYSTRLTQSEFGSLYSPTNYMAGGVHVALMGDLTLRTDYVKPASSLVITPIAGHGANLVWTASSDPAVIGYYIYRTDSAFGYYERISPMITTTSFSDTVGTDGLKYYMVRPVKLQATPAGSYYNLGLGTTNSATVDFPVPTVSAQTLTVTQEVKVFPNPAQNILGVVITCDAPCMAQIYVTDMSGRVLFPAVRQLPSGQSALQLDIHELPAGFYVVCVQTGDRVISAKWTKS
ncbi:MAG: T9SS type A sorting domain-containing protein [Taibaiella sp.]|nr:T9SS type A sorting domain-containing protein [Taibaiella sp.]